MAKNTGTASISQVTFSSRSVILTVTGFVALVGFPNGHVTVDVVSTILVRLVLISCGSSGSMYIKISVSMFSTRP